MEVNLQEKYDKIYSFFKSTTEPFDSLEWDGATLLVILEGDVIEKYKMEELSEFIPGLASN